ncbi:MAG: histidinol-phosphate transaminase [Cellvibrionales bacterium]|nr:histidinol-phosphate transaminase [Cellvibrionales bacterium]
MSQFWQPLIHELTPYTPGEQPDDWQSIKAKLNTNENPYPASPKALAAIREATNEDLKRYPDSDSKNLCQAAAKAYNLQPENVFVGNGSDEVLAHIFQGLFSKKAPILFPDISYSFYPVYANLYQLATNPIPLTEDFSIKTADYPAVNGGIIFPNPNAPTGKYLPLPEIEKLLKVNTDSVVVIDEAYIDFGGESATSLINTYPQLVVTQTLSKSRSLAGLRVGFAFAQPEIIEGLNRVKNSFNSYPIDRLAQAGGAAALQDHAYFTQTTQKVIASREALCNELQRLDFEIIPSKTNFVMAKPTKCEAKWLFEQLKTKGILVRYFNQQRISDYLRISIGTEDENQWLIDEIKALLTAK